MKCWIFTCDEVMSGSLSQAQGLVDAMNLQADTYLTQVQKPWSSLPMRLQPWRTHCFDCPKPPWPDLLVASAKGTIIPALAVKKANPNTHVLYLQNPGYFGKYFDTVIAPIHDNYTGTNATETLGAPHRASKERMKEGINDLPDAYKKLTTPVIGVLIGGDARSHKLDDDASDHMIAELTLFADKHGATLILLPSRRTPKSALQKLEQAFSKSRHIVWDDNTPSPYLGVLGLADAFIVTEESVSMISETAGTGKPVYLFPLTRLRQSKRMVAFQNAMISNHYARWFDGKLDHWVYEPLNETQRVADLVLKRLQHPDT